MKLVLLSGGSGKRLWPLSNDARSKQFLKVLPSDDDMPVSMLQRVVGQIRSIGMEHDTYVCASQAQLDMIQSQVSGANVIVEPLRRDTFPAIALSCTYLAQLRDARRDEIVIVAPVDQYVDAHFFKTIARLPETLLQSGADLALLGVEPTQPSSQYGYIVPDSTRAVRGSAYAPVAAFKEKPSEQVAEALIADGALWNCGVFCFRMSFLLDYLKTHGYPDQYAGMISHFKDMPKKSFDHAVVEGVTSIVVQSYSGTWKDLGTWGSLSDELAGPFTGAGAALACEGTHVINELNIPIIAKGLHHIMVVASPDGILVADKEHCADIKEVVSTLSDRPMYEERRWGLYRVLDFQKLEDGAEVLTKSLEVKSGCNISYQRHEHREEVWTIIQGSGELALDGKVTSVTAGDVVRVCKGQWHALRATEKLVLIEVQRGVPLIEEDVERRLINWDDIVQHCSALVRLVV